MDAGRIIDEAARKWRATALLLEGQLGRLLFTLVGADYPLAQAGMPSIDIAKQRASAQKQCLC